MRNISNNRIKQITDMVSIVKLSSLMLTSIIFFQYIFESERLSKEYIYGKVSYSAIFIVLLGLLFIYFIWLFQVRDKYDTRKEKYGKVIEYIIFLSIFFGAMIISGGKDSQYKNLFLFIICTSTIESGLKTGLTIASISSLLILIFDLFTGDNSGVNVHFQNDLVLAGIFMLTAWPLGFYVKIEGEHIKVLEELVNRDGVTGLYNHMYFQNTLKAMVNEAKKKKEQISLIFFDIDSFKHYNDLNGHQKGDEVLKHIGEIVLKNLRKQDIAARYGGEEFAIILPNTNEAESMEIADQLRRIIEKEKFYGEENQPNGTLTVSLGISIYPDKARNEIELLKSADDALYRAKFFNKNRVETYKSILEDLEKDIDDKDIELVTSIKTLISVINAKDRYTYGHSERVVVYSRLMAEKLKLNNQEKNNLIYGAYMHDVGKINVPKEVLNKKMPLTNEEWELLKQHSENGVEIVRQVNKLEGAIPIILHHHEKFDGTGYPHQLKGKEIPYLARILCIVDSFDSMTSKRPYNKIKSYQEAVEELKRCSGTHFDPELTKIFIEVIEENQDKFDKIR